MVTKVLLLTFFKSYAKHVMANVTVPKSSTSSNPASSNPALDSSGEMETSKESESLWRLAFAFFGATGRWTVTLVLLLVSCLDSQLFGQKSGSWLFNDIHWGYPPPTNSEIHNLFIFMKGPYKPSHSGDTPKIYIRVMFF